MKQKLLLLMVFLLSMSVAKAADVITLGTTSISKVYDPGSTQTITVTKNGVFALDAMIVTSDANVVTGAYNGIGDNLELTFKNKGTATITVQKSGDPSVKATINVTITQKLLTLSLSGAPLSLDYDSSLSSRTISRSSSDFSLNGIFPGDIVSLQSGNLSCEFVSSNVGSGINVTVSGYTLDGPGKDNYIINQTTTLTGTITKSNQLPNLGLSSTSFTQSISDDYIKFNITAKGGAPTAQRVVSTPSDVVSAPTITAKGNNVFEISFPLLKPSTPGSEPQYRLMIDGSTNYNGSEVLVTLTVNAPSSNNTIKWTATPPASIAYGTTYMMTAKTDDSAPITYSLVGGSPDDVSIVGNNITFRKISPSVTIKVTAAQTRKYKETSITQIFNVIAKELTVNGINPPIIKTYNGSAIAIIDWSRCSLSGILFGDDVVLDYSGASATYGTAITPITDASTTSVVVTVSGLTLTGSKSANYTIKPITGITGRIDKANQPDAFLNPSGGKSISGFIGDEWDYSSLIAAAISNPVVVGNPSNTTILEKDEVGKKIKFKAAGTASVTFTAPTSTNYNTGSVTITFTVVANKALVISTNNPSGDFKQPYKTAPKPLLIAGEYMDGGTQAFNDFTFSYSNDNVEIIKSSGVYYINYKKAGQTVVTVNAGSTLPSGISKQPFQFTVTVDKLDLPITNITINPRDYSPNDRSVPANWTSASIAPLSGDDAHLSATNRPILTYETEKAGDSKKILISNFNNCITGADVANYNPVINVTGKVNKASQGNLGYPNDVMTLNMGNNFNFNPLVSENAFLEYSPTANQYAEFQAFNIGILKLKKVMTSSPGVELRITARATENYRDTTKVITLYINKGDQIFGITSPINRQIQDGAWRLDPQVKDNASCTYTLASGGDVITLDSDGTITPKKNGNAQVIIQSAATSNYNAGTKVVDIVISDGLAITTQPIGASICQGSTYSFTVGVSGAVTAYQWLFNGVAISGATQSVYTIDNARASHSGKYSVRVSSATKTVTSSEAALVVSGTISINSHLKDSTLCVGGKDTLRVYATGNQLSYEWYFNNRLLAGERDSALLVVGAAKTDAGKYKVVVTGTCQSQSSGTISTTTASDSCSLTVVSPLPSRIKDNIPDTMYTNKNYSIEIGEAGTSGYEGITKYTWSFTDPTLASFNTQATAINKNTFSTKTVSGKGNIRVDMDHICGGINNFILKEVKVLHPTGIESVSSAGMKVYPNPVTTNENLNIDLGEGNNSASIYIYNITGSLVIDSELVSQLTSFPLNLRSGIYMMKIVTSNGKTVHHKFIVK